MSKAVPLLLTATIIPQTTYELNLTDKTKRYHQYVHNLIKLIALSDFESFVFCENSGADIPDRPLLEQLCKYYGKKIEFISFVGNAKLIKKYTRAYGDQEIMEYALKHSQILSEHEVFYKLTGRYWVENINDIIKAWEDRETVFIKGGLGRKTVHTCFFKCSKTYFNWHFLEKYPQLVNYPNHSLEYLYYDKIKQSGINMTINHTHPIFSGEWGAGGRMDESPLMRIKTKIFAYLGIYDIITTKIETLPPKH